MRKTLSQVRVFALKGYTVKTDRGKFYVSPTGSSTWSGPYKSLQHATTAIARKLAREFTDRHERLQKWQEQRRG